MLIRLLLIFSTIIFLSGCLTETDPIKAFRSGDYQTAYKLWLPLAKEKDSQAQNYLGILYHLGLGVDKNDTEALKWYGMAARNGQLYGQRNYADMFYAGRGTKRDIYQAFKWYFASAQQGNHRARRQMEMIAASGNLSPNQQMYAKVEANEFILDETKHFKVYHVYD